MENFYGMGRNGIPQRLTGIKIGDIVRIVSLKKINKMKRLGIRIRCSWKNQMDGLCGSQHIITGSEMGRIEYRDDNIFKKDGFSISLDMLEFVKEQDNENEESKEMVDNVFSTFGKEKDESIINEMIKKVDRSRFKKLLVIGANRDSFKFSSLTNEIVDFYLQSWAYAKYEFYLLLGRNLTFNKAVELEMTSEDMDSRRNELAYVFPQYCYDLKSFSTEELLNNSVEGDPMYEKFCPIYMKGMKVSKFLSALHNDQRFDDAIAGLLSNRTINANLTISIDPFDYLTMSLNKHDWKSCQKIGEGSYATGALSIMIDETTLMAYRHNGVEYDYNYHNYRFTGNSKSWRECLYIDKNTGSVIFSRQYPSSVDAISNIVREMTEEIVANYTEHSNRWILKESVSEYYHEGSGLLYHDVIQGFPFKFAVLKDLNKKIEPSFTVGKPIFCLNCKKEINDSEDTFLCDNCS